MVAAVLEERGRKGRIVGIVTAEQHVRWNGFRHLHHAAVVAEGEPQGNARLRLVELALLQKGVGERLRPEVEKDREVRPRTGTTEGQSRVRAGVLTALYGARRVDHGSPK